MKHVKRKNQGFKSCQNGDIFKYRFVYPVSPYIMLKWD